MNKKIGIDIDDCICNTLELDLACGLYYAQKHNIPLPENAWQNKDFYIPRAFSFSKEQEMDYFLQEKKYIMKHTAMYPKVFVKEVISNLKKQGFTIYFITSRDNIFWNGNSYKYSKKWLKKHRIKYNKLFAGIQDKVALCKKLNLDFMIEDNPDHASKLNQNDINTILIKTEYNQNYDNSKNFFAYNWLDLYHKLGDIYKFETNNILEE